MRQIWIILAVIWMHPTAGAVVTIEDQGRVWEDLKSFHRGQPFAQAFVCGSEGSFKSTHPSCNYRCTDSFCVTKCTPYEHPREGNYGLYVEDCSSEQVHIYGDNGLAIAVSKAEYEGAGGNWVQAFLKASGHFLQPEGRVILEGTSRRVFDYVESGRRRVLPVTIIYGSFRSGESAQGLAFELAIAEEFEGVRQIVLFRLDYETVFLNLKGVVDASIPQPR